MVISEKTLSHAESIVQSYALAKMVESGVDPRQSAMAIGEWWDCFYLPSIKQHCRSWRCMQRSFDRHVRPVVGERTLNQVTTSDLTRLIDGLRPSVNGSRQIDHLSNASINRVIALVKKMFRTLHEQGLILSNPAAGLRQRPERNRRVEVLREEDYEVFFRHLSLVPIKIQCFVWLLVLTGMRMTEALTARWDALDFERRTLYLPETKNGHARIIDLSDEAITVCNCLMYIRVNDWLFPGRSNNPMSRPTRHLRRVFEEAGLRELWLHDLRRTFATLAAREVPLADVSRFLGHSSVKVTERYVVIPDQRLREVATLVGRQFTPLLSSFLSDGVVME